MTIAFNSVSDSWLTSISFSILSEDSSFPFIWGLFLCLPIVCETLPVSLCFLSCSVLTPWINGVNVCGRIPVKFSCTVSLISGAYCSWAVVYVGSVCVFGFWFLLGVSFLQVVCLMVTFSPTSCFLFCRCRQVVLELVLPCVQGFEAFLLLLFICLLWVISSLFSCISE